MSSASASRPPDQVISQLIEQAGGLPVNADDTLLKQVGLIGPAGEVANLADEIRAAGMDVHSASTSLPGTELTAAIQAMQECQLVLLSNSECHPGLSLIESAMDSLASGETVLAAPAFTGSATNRFANRSGLASWAACRLSPLHGQARLIEFMPHRSTSTRVGAAIQALGKRCQWPVVQVPDATAAPCWRIESAMLYEAMAMVGEAVAPESVEQSALALGMATGPLLRLDQVGLDLVDHLLHAELHALAHGDDHDHDHHGHDHHGDDHDHHGHDHGHQNNHDHGHDHAGHDHGHSHAHGVQSKVMHENAVYVMEKMAHGFNRLGLQAGAGFYDYDYDDEPPELWEGLSAFGRGADKADPADCDDRMLIIAAVQALKCVEDGLLGSPAQADLVAVLGAGFPARLGGPVNWIKTIGRDQFVDKANALAERYGERFTPPQNLASLVE